MLTRVGHLAVGLLGLLFLYLALFLTETAEGGIQNRLEELWVRVDDLSKTALSKQAALLQQVAELLGDGLDLLFGVKLFSARSSATSINLSLAAMFLFLGLFQLHYKSAPLFMRAYPDLLVGLVFLVVGLSPVPVRYLAFLVPIAAVGFGLYRDWELALLDWDVKYLVGEFGPVLGILLGGAASQTLFVAASRWYLRKSAKISSGWRNLTLLLFTSCLALLLVSPVVAMFAWPHAHFAEARALLRNRAVITVFLVGTSNLFTALVPLFFGLLCIVALLHQVLWPALKAPIYSAQRYGLARQPKLLGALGVLCLTFAWPGNPLVALVAKVVHA